MLRCLRCGCEYAFDPTAYLCHVCGAGNEHEDAGILEVLYRTDIAGERLLADLAGNRRGVFRYRALLPAVDDGAGLPVGNTPLVPVQRMSRALGLRGLHLKDETRNPTRCLKDRATAVGVLMAATSNKRDLYCASAGNAAISLAGFCAHRGYPCHVFVPEYVSQERLAWLRYYGADIQIAEGDYDTAFAQAEDLGQQRGWYSRNCAFNPFLVEGKKTTAFEIAETLEWRLPDLVVAPVGDGCTLAALGKGFRELRDLGLTATVPRLLGVQSEAMQPMVRRFTDASGTDSGDTSAASINVRRPRNALRLLRELEEAEGSMIAVSDEAIAEAQIRLARQAGVVVEFTAAAGLAGLEAAVREGSFGDATAVIVLTGGRVDEEDTERLTGEVRAFQ